MNLIDRKQVLPPGLMDDAVEFFIYENEIWCLYKGRQISFKDFPDPIKNVLDADMKAHPKAMKALFDWDITDPESRMRQYVACRFGGFDNTPDVCGDGVVQPAEYVDCGRRGSCDYEGKLCSSIVLRNGILTPREIEVLRHIGNDLLDKEICDVLQMANDTLRTHKDKISLKNGSTRKSALAKLAYKYNLINN
jgi:DNA-binding CsgD family transcriptional regulator